MSYNVRNLMFCVWIAQLLTDFYVTHRLINAIIGISPTL